MAVNLNRLVKSIHRTAATAFSPSPEKAIKVFTPGYVSANYNIDPTFSSEFVSANAIIITFNTAERLEPGNENKEFTIFLNKESADITSETHIEFEGVRWDCKDIKLIGDAEWIFAVEKL